MAFAVENLLDKGPSGYKPKWGWAIAKMRNKVKGTAVQECYAADPRNRECKLDFAEHAGSFDSPSTFNGGPWHNP